MKADPTAQRRLLDLQRIDTAISQLEHRAKTLPEHALLAERQTKRSGLGQQLVAAETVLSDAVAAQERAEADLEPVRARLTRNQKLIDDGSVSDPKTLRSMVEETEHLKVRISTLEDTELELMQAREDAEAARDAILTQKTDLETEMRGYLAKRDEAVKSLQADVAERRKARAEVLSDLPAPLVAMYDKVRERAGGTGAAELKGRRCTGCGLEATSADYERYVAAPEDEVLRCEECDRILVRTEAS